MPIHRLVVSTACASAGPMNNDKMDMTIISGDRCIDASFRRLIRGRRPMPFGSAVAVLPESTSSGVLPDNSGADLEE